MLLASLQPVHVLLAVVVARPPEEDTALLLQDRLEMAADGGDCEKVLASFAKAGVDVDALAKRLQDEGAASFVKSWNDLIGVIGSKSSALRRAS